MTNWPEILYGPDDWPDEITDEEALWDPDLPDLGSMAAFEAGEPVKEVCVYIPLGFNLKEGDSITIDGADYFIVHILESEWQAGQPAKLFRLTIRPAQV